MGKRIFCLILALVLCVPFLSCGKKEDGPAWEDDDAMKEWVEESGIWYATGTTADGLPYLRFLYFEDGKNYDYLLCHGEESTEAEDILYSVMRAMRKSGDDLGAWGVESFLNDEHPTGCGMTVTERSVEYDAETGCVSNEDEKFFMYFEDKSEGEINQTKYKKTDASMDDSVLTAKFRVLDEEEEKEAEKEQEFLEKHQATATYREVKYNPSAYVGKNFHITAKVSLDDYYNYGYRGTESRNFCMQLDLADYSYCHVYADRTKFADLYEILLSGKEPTLLLACKAQYGESAKNGLFTLVAVY